MDPITLDARFDELLQIGITADPTLVAFQAATQHPDKPTFAFTIPSHQLTNWISRMTAGAARTAVLEARAAGGDVTAIQIAERRAAFKADSAGLTKSLQDGESLLTIVGTFDGAFLPIELTRDAALQLLASLSEHLAS
jgi:hypothetical protein